MAETIVWHCENCGLEYVRSQYSWHSKGCPNCRKQRWREGKTANCSKCDIYQICHESIKGMCPEYNKTCLHFRDSEINREDLNRGK